MHIIVFLTLLYLVTQPVLTQQPTQKEMQEQMQQMVKGKLNPLIKMITPQVKQITGELNLIKLDF